MQRHSKKEGKKKNDNLLINSRGRQTKKRSRKVTRGAGQLYKIWRVPATVWGHDSKVYNDVGWTFRMSFQDEALYPIIKVDGPDAFTFLLRRTSSKAIEERRSHQHSEIKCFWAHYDRMSIGSRLQVEERREPCFCLHFHRLNVVTVRDSYPTPQMDKCSSYLGVVNVFLIWDANSSSWKCELDKHEMNTTAFVAHRELYPDTHMPFGLKYAPATFQRAMDSIMDPFTWQNILVYIYNTTIISRSVKKFCIKLSPCYSQ